MNLADSVEFVSLKISVQGWKLRARKTYLRYYNIVIKNACRKVVHFLTVTTILKKSIELYNELW